MHEPYDPNLFSVMLNLFSQRFLSNISNMELKIRIRDERGGGEWLKLKGTQSFERLLK